jgi:tetratricopeptide (TPR) repeat protein
MQKTLTRLLMLAAVAVLSNTRATADDLATKAMTAFNQQKYQQAEDSFRQICEAEPANARAHYYLALCFSKQKKQELAKEELTFVVNSFPDSKEAEYSSVLLSKIATAESPAPEPKSIKPPEKAVDTTNSDRDYEAAVAQAAEIRKSAKERAKFYTNSANQQAEEMRQVMRGKSMASRAYSDADIDAANTDFMSQAKRIIDEGDREAEEVLHRAQLRRDAGPH